MRKLFSALALTLVVSGVALAQAGSPVWCGSMTAFEIHATAEGKSAGARADQAMDIINKYLGGKLGKVSTKAAGKNVALLLNGEKVAVVTPADASAERQKSVTTLAAKWSRSLAVAFDASKAQK